MTSKSKPPRAGQFATIAIACLLSAGAFGAMMGCNDRAPNAGDGGLNPPPPANNAPPNPPANLPPGVLSIAAGFEIAMVVDGLNTPSKMAFAPDGRLFFTELRTGDIRVIDTGGNLWSEPWAHLDVLQNGEAGLLGIEFSPTFAVDGFVYVFASVGAPDRNQVIRFTESLGAGTSPTVIVDNLPVGTIHNAGDIKFLADGTFIVSIGDTGDSALSQQDGALAGRILRYAADGSIPADNPDPASPEFCRGLRNSFDLAIHPATGGIFATENGPTANDELNYIQPGKNFEWQELPPGFPGAQVGIKLQNWAEVIAPTGIAAYGGTAFGADYANDLFIASYSDARVLYLPMSGPFFADIDDEIIFVQFDDTNGIDHKPLDLRIGPDGALYIATFTAIWRVTPE